MKPTESQREVDGKHSREKIEDALRILLVAYYKKQITGNLIPDILSDWARNGTFGFTEGQKVNNLIGWELMAEFAHELRNIASSFYSRLQKQQDWVDINGLINFMKANGFKISDERTIERNNSKWEESDKLQIDVHYRYVNDKEKEYNKHRYLELYREHLKSKKIKFKR